MKNELLIASAGAGKTTLIVTEALNCSESVLITTFTEENEREIRKKVSKKNNGIIPSNITISTWFSFLIEHGAKPYQGKMTSKKITGLNLVNKKSGLKYQTETHPVYYNEEDVEHHYFDSDFQIYSDKLSKFVFQCNKKSNGAVVERISAIFKNIFIDEVQDMAGYDLELIKLLFSTNSTVKMAGDPRQVTYHTHFSEKYKKYTNGKIQKFVENECKSLKCEIDTKKLSGSYRNNQIICDFANSLFPNYPKCNSLQEKKTGHDGVFLVKEKDVKKYLREYLPTQLRNSRREKKVDPNYEVKNYGESKGITRDRVLIYPTKKILNWIFEKKDFNNFDSQCKFYVAVTRAKYSVGIVCKNNSISCTLPFYE